MLNNLVFGNYDKHFTEPDLPNKWLCANPESLRAYDADPDCGFQFTDAAYRGLGAVLGTVQKHYRLSRDAEVTLEANPDSAGDWKALRALRRAGVNRVSLGMQSACDEELAAIGRVHTHAQTAVVGISGGLDSTLALLVTAMTFDALQIPRDRIIGITMPGFGTTGRTYNNAVSLIRSLGVTLREISIKEACVQHFKDINHDMDNHDVTYENSQARERTQILMDVANQANGLVIGTGDLSELALGWATYNGDHMSMYGVNGSIPKTLVKYLVEWVANHKVDEQSKATLLDIVDTPISPELIPADEQGNIRQKTEDLVGPYELHDFFLYHFLRFGASPAKIYFLAQKAFAGSYDTATIHHWLRTFFRRFFQQQFKRSCLPDGPKVGSITLSPRGDWRMPSDAMATLWLNEIDQLK